MRVRRFASREARTLAVVTAVVVGVALLLLAYGVASQAFPPADQVGANLGPGIGYATGTLVLIVASVLALVTALLERRARLRRTRS